MHAPQWPENTQNSGSNQKVEIGWEFRDWGDQRAMMNARLNVHNVRPCAAVPMRARVARVLVPRAAGGSKEGASASGYSVAGMYVVRRPSPVARSS